MNINKSVKDSRGQVLLMVIITSTIALLIITGLFMRVLRLNQQKVDLETHEIAFTVSEKYSRQILDAFETGKILNQNDLDNLVTNNSDLVSATVEKVPSIDDVELSAGETFEIYKMASGIVTEFTVSDWTAGERILFTTVYYSGGQYSLQKRIFNSCSVSEGDLVVSCSVNVISYTHKPNEVAVRVRPIGGEVNMDISSGGALANEYFLTTKNGESLSEISLLVDLNKAMPSLFDYVVFNGKGTITKP